jgi:hypothetical protein
MSDENEKLCSEDMDLVNHMLIEQITRICVEEEDERIREELKKEK